MLWGKPVRVGRSQPSKRVPVRVPQRRDFLGQEVNITLSCAFPSACPKAGFFRENAVDKDSVKLGILIGIGIIVAINLLSFVLVLTVGR